MDQTVRTDILKVLDASSLMIEKNDMIGLKELSNHTIHNASIFQDEDSVTVAVVIYTLAKIFERQGSVDRSFVPIVNKAKNSLFENKLDSYKEEMKKIYDNIKNRDSKHSMYIQEVMEQAGIKKSSKIYDHGLSMARAASILGVSQWELMEYVGKTRMADTFKEHINLKKRLAVARKIFGG